MQCKGGNQHYVRLDNTREITYFSKHKYQLFYILLDGIKMDKIKFNIIRKITIAFYLPHPF